VVEIMYNTTLYELEAEVFGRLEKRENISLIKETEQRSMKAVKIYNMICEVVTDVEMSVVLHRRLQTDYKAVDKTHEEMNNLMSKMLHDEEFKGMLKKYLYDTAITQKEVEANDLISMIRLLDENDNKEYVK
jgi:hypothetical protein